ncbi:unnamed protein product [Lepeophtheirus salmonis]|uniref:(salmon louse) hypothetical protein n=1 Tax=Lepeophtheirus salmonis TaxID=72036 RepID=A0A7R8CJN4_LEPSM|nr:unnamed protein product [Lepeophtheirus salmonis]CAF2807612.1 unnamed protein product [Lepeophtheirus salmonis]
MTQHLTRWVSAFLSVNVPYLRSQGSAFIGNSSVFIKCISLALALFHIASYSESLIEYLSVIPGQTNIARLCIISFTYGENHKSQCATYSTPHYLCYFMPWVSCRDPTPPCLDPGYSFPGHISVRIKICKKPVRKYDMGSANSISLSLPGVESHDTERRRQIALKALSERLSKSENSPSTVSTAWPKMQKSDESTNENTQGGEENAVVEIQIDEEVEVIPAAVDMDSLSVENTKENTPLVLIRGLDGVELLMNKNCDKMLTS